MESFEESRAYRRLMLHAIKNLVPLNVLLELTFDCNLNCICCYNVKQKDRLLSVTEYDQLFRDLRNAGTFLVTLTGGEPLMRHDFFDILEIVRKHGFALRIFTNGTLLDEEKVIRIKEFSPVGIELSIWGSNPELNDKLMGKPGAFEKILNAASLLKKHGIITTVKTTVCSENHLDFTGIKKVVEDIGVEFRYSLLLSLKTDGDTGNQAHRMTEEQMKAFYKLHDTVYDATDFERDLIDDQVLRENSELPEYMCLAGISSCKIDPFGEVNPCVDIPVSAGNIRLKSFDEIWRKGAVMEELRNLRMKDALECFGCKYIDHCHRCPGMALLEGGSLTAKYEYGCSLARVDRLFRKK